MVVSPVNKVRSAQVLMVALEPVEIVQKSGELPAQEVGNVGKFVSLTVISVSNVQSRNRHFPLAHTA